MRQVLQHHNKCLLHLASISGHSKFVTN